MLVVGAGPVGLTAALTLARRGVSVCLFEAEDGPGSRSHASTFHPPTLDIFDKLGVCAALLERGRVASRVQYRDRDLGILAEFDLADLAAHTAHPYRLQVEQGVYCRLAAAELVRLPGARICYRTRIDAAHSDFTKALLRSGSRMFEAAWAIAADGASSVVRRALGLAFEGTTYPVRYLTVKTDLAIDRLLEGIAPVTYVSGGAAGYGLLELRDHWRIVLRTFGAEPSALSRDRSLLQQRLKEVVSRTPGHYPIIDAFEYPVHRRVASAFAVGRVLLAGDAAHLNSPTGGMGMNSGIHDAYALAHAVADELEGRVTPQFVHAVAAERRRVATEIVGPRSESNLREILADLQARRERAARLAAIASDPTRSLAHLRAASLLDAAPSPR